MKVGLVMSCFVLAAFAKFGGRSRTLGGSVNRRRGNRQSRRPCGTEARRARVVFNSEPGRFSGNVATGREGGVFMGVWVTGKAAYAGANFSDGDQRDRGTGPRDPDDPRADRPGTRH
jgi:glutamate carboxypeptidase